MLVLTTQPIVCCSWWRTFPVGEAPVALTTQQVGKAFGQFGACFFVAVYVNVPLSRETEPDVNVVLTGVAFERIGLRHRREPVVQTRLSDRQRALILTVTVELALVRREEVEDARDRNREREHHHERDDERLPGLRIRAG